MPNGSRTEQPRRPLGRDHPVERRGSGERGDRPHEQHRDQADPQRRLQGPVRVGTGVHLQRGDGREGRGQQEADRSGQHEAAVRAAEHHAGRGQRVQGQEAGAGEQDHRHQEEPLVAAAAGDLADDQAEHDVQRRDDGHQPEVRRMVLPVHVQRRPAEQQGEAGDRDDQRGCEEHRRGPRGSSGFHLLIMPGCSRSSMARPTRAADATVVVVVRPGPRQSVSSICR